MKVPTSPAVPSWIAASMGMEQSSPPAVKISGVAEEPSTGGGGLDWLQQASTELREGGENRPWN